MKLGRDVIAVIGRPGASLPVDEPQSTAATAQIPMLAGQFVDSPEQLAELLTLDRPDEWVRQAE